MRTMPCNHRRLAGHLSLSYINTKHMTTGVYTDIKMLISYKHISIFFLSSFLSRPGLI